MAESFYSLTGKVVQTLTPQGHAVLMEYEELDRVDNDGRVFTGAAMGSPRPG